MLGERFFEFRSLPIEWKSIKLRSAAQIGGFIDGDWIESPYITNEGIRLVQTGNIGIGMFLEKPDSKKFISQKSFKELGCKWVYPGDILISRLADPIGRSCQIPQCIGPCVTAVDCTIFRPDSKIVSHSFVLQFLNWKHQLNRLEALAGGSTRQRISRSNLGDIRIPAPPLPEQRRIAEILDSADEAIRATERVIAKLKQVKKGLLHDLLTRGLDENGQLRDPEAHPEQFKESALGRIPRSWKVYRLDDLPITYPNGNYGEMYPRAEDFTDRGVPFIRANNIKLGTVVSDEMRFISPELHAKLTRGHLKPGDVLITTRGELGNVALVPEQYFGANINAQLVIIRSTDTSISRWFFYSAQTNRFYRQIRELTTGTALKQLPASKLKQIQIVLPSENERSKIITLVNANDARIRAEEAKLAKLKQVKRGLMDDLLTGKVRVS